MADDEQNSALGKYEGERNERGERHGQGKCTFANGDVYQGSYVSGKRNGQGSYKWAASNGDAKFVGQYKDGLRHGQGKFWYPDGSKYEGQFIAGKRQGQGTFTYVNGDVYQGNWLDDKRHGSGVYTYAGSKSRKEGVWSNGRLCGQATIQHNDHVISLQLSQEGKHIGPIKLEFPSTGYKVQIDDTSIIEQMLESRPAL